MNTGPFGIPKTEDLRREAHIQRYGTEELPPRGTGMLQKEVSREVSNLVSPNKVVLVTTITSAATGAGGFTLSQVLKGESINIWSVLIAGIGGGLIGSVAGLIVSKYFAE